MAGLIVTDLDGTLLGKDGRVSERNRAALRAAPDAGWHVAIATGRTWAESHRAIDCISEDAFFIGASGASLHEAGSGKVLATATVDARAALDIADAIIRHGHRAHVLLDASMTGHDYVFLGTADLDAATKWWLSEHPVIARDWHAAPDDAHVHLADAVLRVGTIGPAAEMDSIVGHVEDRWGGSLAVRSWSALTAEEAIGSRTHMLEVFSRTADKWSMACEAAARLGIDPRRIVALGDGLNDLDMIRSAPLGVAMGNADERIRRVARAHTRSHDRDGVAVAVEALLGGELVPGWRAPEDGA